MSPHSRKYRKERRLHMEMALPFPPSVNALYIPCRSRIILSKKAREFHALFAQVLHQQGHPGMATGFLEVEVWACPPNRRARDVDNLLKALFDALQKTEVFENDSQIKSVHAVMDHWPFADGSVIVRIYEVDAHDYEDRRNAQLLRRFQCAKLALGLPVGKDIPRPRPPFSGEGK